jgi:hypothetical protein
MARPGKRVRDPARKHEPRKFPYWKIQYYIDRSLSWRDVQTAFYDKEEAIAEAKQLGKARVRLMEIRSAKEREPLPELTEES